MAVVVVVEAEAEVVAVVVDVGAMGRTAMGEVAMAMTSKLVKTKARPPAQAKPSSKLGKAMQLLTK